MRPAVSKTPTKKSFFSLMKGDIAQRSIRSSMSRIVDARLPRMISRVTGSTRRASATAALQQDVVGVVHARAESWSDQRRRVVLGDDGGALEAHPRRQGAPPCRARRAPAPPAHPTSLRAVSRRRLERPPALHPGDAPPFPPCA